MQFDRMIFCIDHRHFPDYGKRWSKPDPWENQAFSRLNGQRMDPIQVGRRPR